MERMERRGNGSERRMDEREDVCERRLERWMDGCVEWMNKRVDMRIKTSLNLKIVLLNNLRKRARI